MKTDSPSYTVWIAVKQCVPGCELFKAHIQMDPRVYPLRRVSKNPERDSFSAVELGYA